VPGNEKTTGGLGGDRHSEDASVCGISVDSQVTRLGVIFTADRPPEELPAFAAAAESAGLDELWLWEDCFLAGGIAASATALAATHRITVGLGVMPAVFRNPVACAMEIATLARLHPGRFIAGLGHGVPGWMDQIGALPTKPVRALEETVTAIRRLLAGERITTVGEQVNLRDAQLEQAPAEVPPVVLGVRRPFGLRASGRSADGTILAEPAAPAYIHWARERIDEGRASAGRNEPHRLTVFVKGRLDADRKHAREWVARILLDESVAAQLAPLETGQIDELRALGDPVAVAGQLSDVHLDQLTATGTPDQVLASLTAIAEAGVDSIAFAPIGPNPDQQLQLLARIVPAFRAVG
jgi:5,10-methylenetetrahydromethanopterin reductase